jgi:hypothetical protein
LVKPKVCHVMTGHAFVSTLLTFLYRTLLT